MTARKIIGSLLVIFIGLPVLFGVTMAVGLVRATVSDKFLSDLPRDIIAEIPGTVDGLFRDIRDKDLRADEATQAWFDAAEKTGISPRTLMESTGLMAWLQGEVSESLRQLGEVLRGNSPVRSIAIDMRPLKKALLHPDMDRFFESLVANLPPCDERNQEIWKEKAAGVHDGRDLPPCRPDAVLARDIFLNERTRAVEDIDDTIQILENVHPFPFERFGFAKVITWGSYLLFLLPALIILAGVLIAAKTRSGRLLWSGISVLVGSVPALILALGIQKFTAWVMRVGSFSWHHPWSSDVGRVVMDRLDWIPLQIVNTLFSPVVGVAAVVAVIGMVLIALSYSHRPAVPAAPAPALKR